MINGEAEMFDESHDCLMLGKVRELFETTTFVSIFFLFIFSITSRSIHRHQFLRLSLHLVIHAIVELISIISSEMSPRSIGWFLLGIKNVKLFSKLRVAPISYENCIDRIFFRALAKLKWLYAVNWTFCLFAISWNRWSRPISFVMIMRLDLRHV